MAKRLLKELAQLQKEQDFSEIVLYPRGEDGLFEWKAFIRGPPDSGYHNGVFELDVTVPPNYPIVPPKVRFVTKVFHPNVHFKTGEICIDVLQDAWSAVYTLQSILRSIISLLALPAPDSPLNCDAGNLLRAGDNRGYESLSRMYTLLYASRPLPPSPWQ